MCFTKIFQISSQINKKKRNISSKNFVLKHTILYIHYVDLLMWSITKLNFLFYNFSMIYYNFSKV